MDLGTGSCDAPPTAVEPFVIPTNRAALAWGRCRIGGRRAT
jgi:hypothetical protein